MLSKLTKIVPSALPDNKSCSSPSTAIAVNDCGKTRFCRRVPVTKSHILQVPSSEHETRTELKLPEVVNRPVMAELCSEEEHKGAGKFPKSAMSSKLPRNPLETPYIYIYSFSRDFLNKHHFMVKVTCIDVKGKEHNLQFKIRKRACFV